MTDRQVRAALVVLALAAVVRADDPPKPPAPAEPTAPAPAAPAAGKHENKVADAAKAAFDKIEKTANCPVALGLKAASGKITTGGMAGQTVAMKFTFAAPSAVHVELEPDAEDQMATFGKHMTGPTELTLRRAMGLIRPAEGGEFDADVTKKDGKEVLVVTTFKDGAEQDRAEYGLDANGLPATLASRTQIDMRGQKVEVKGDTVFTWTKAGDHFRLEKAETTRSGGRGAGQKQTVSFSYVEVGKFAFPASWKSQMTGMTFESRFEDLVIDGAKVEIKLPEVTKLKPKKSEESDDGDDEDDEEDEKGGKKEGGKDGKK